VVVVLVGVHVLMVRLRGVVPPFAPPDRPPTPTASTVMGAGTTPGDTTSGDTASGAPAVATTPPVDATTGEHP
jgi:hypothetical protein